MAEQQRCHESHVTTSSDASTFDEICINCGATDITGGGWGRLVEPCPYTEEVQRMLSDWEWRDRR